MALASPSLGQRGNGTFATPPIKVQRGVAPQSPLQGMPRVPAQQQCAPRPVGVVAGGIRPVMQQTFAQPPSPFSPQAPQSPHDFPQSPASAQDHFQQRFNDGSEQFAPGNQTPRGQMAATPTPPYSTSPRNEVFPPPGGTPRPIFNSPVPTRTHVYAPSRAPDPYSSQMPPSSPAPPPTVANYPSPRQDAQPRPAEQSGGEAFPQQPADVNRQLRDLLQQHHMNKKPEGMNTPWNQGFSLFVFG